MHRLYVSLLFGLSLLSAGQVLAEPCIGPLSSTRVCCVHPDTVTGLASHNGLGGGLSLRATIENRNPGYITNSVSQCFTNAMNTSRNLSFSAGCANYIQDNLYDLLPGQELDPVLSQLNPDGSTSHSQQLRYVGYDYIYYVQNNAILKARTICVDGRGYAAWITPKPLPPCLIPDLLPKPTDVCSRALEETFGNLPPGDTRCPTAKVMTATDGHSCFLRKVQALGVNYTTPTSTYRPTGYQAHLADVWEKLLQHTNPYQDPLVYESCSTKRAVVLTEQSGHKLGYEPSGQSHLGNAFDVDGTTVALIMNAVPQLQAHLDRSAPGDAACNLRWGFLFGDKYHFSTK